jgi:hypothetical protein
MKAELVRREHGAMVTTERAPSSTPKPREGEPVAKQHPMEQVLVDVSRAARSAAHGAAILSALSPWGFASGLLRRGHKFLGLAQRGGYILYRIFRKTTVHKVPPGQDPRSLAAAAHATIRRTHVTVAHVERHARRPIPGAILATAEVAGMVFVFGAASTVLGVAAAYLVHQAMDRRSPERGRPPVGGDRGPLLLGPGDSTPAVRALPRGDLRE